MEITEFLYQNQIEIKSTAKELSKMLDKYKASSDFEQSFRKLQALRGGEAFTAKQFSMFVMDKAAELEAIDPSLKSQSEKLEGIIRSTISGKEKYSEQMTKQRVDDAQYKADYYEKIKPVDIEVDLFQIIDKEPNKHDRSIYKCFCKAGNQIVFRSTELNKLILQNVDGSLALGNDLASSSEGSMWNSICRAMKDEFKAYRAILQAELAAIKQEDLDIEHSQNIIEEIFLNKVPCSFSHLVNVVKRFKKGDDGKLHYAGFRIKPNRKMLDSFDFDGFVSALAKNFQKMTRGALDEFNEYRAFSNRLDEAAITHLILPNEETWKAATIPDKWKEFFHGKASPRMLQRIFWYIGAMQDAKNYAQQALIISAAGKTGKSTLLEMLYRIFPKDFFGPITNGTLDEKQIFALSERKAYEHHCLVLDEYDGSSINGAVFKRIIGTPIMTSLSVKNRDSILYNFKGTKMILISNELSVLNDRHYQRRVIPVSFVKNCVKGVNAYTEADKDELVEHGKEFLNFCYRVYKESKLTQPNGDYHVMCPEHEEKFLNGEDIGLDDETVTKRAFTDDEELNGYFDIRDYEESETNLEFTNFIIDRFRKVDDPSVMLMAKDLIDFIEDLANVKNSTMLDDLQSMFGQALQFSNGRWRVEHRCKLWWQFTQAMKDYGFMQKNVRVGNHVHKAWIGVETIPVIKGGER